MQPLTDRSKQVPSRKMTWMESIYFPAILNGIRITMRHFFKKNVTISYPERNGRSARYTGESMC